MAGRKHGKNGQIKLDPAGGSSLVTLADVNSWGMDLSQDRVDVTCFGDTNKQRVAGLSDFSGTIGGQWNTASSPTLFAAILAGTPVTLRLVPDSQDPTYYFQGLANLDGGLQVDATGSVKFTGKWDAAGDWDMAP